MLASAFSVSSLAAVVAEGVAVRHALANISAVLVGGAPRGGAARAPPQQPARRYSTANMLQVTVEPLGGAHEGVSLLTLDRPDARNALGRQLVRELFECIDTLRQERTTRAVLLRSAVPGCFSAGADLKERASMTAREAAECVSSLRRLAGALAALPMPTLAVVEGYALGGGAELALACDLRVASASASLAFPEARLGIIPGAGGTQRLPRLVGLAAAKELVFTGRRVGGEEAAGLRLVDHCVADGKAMERALEISKDIAQCAPLSLRMAKAAMSGGAEVDLASGLALEEACYAQLLPTRDRLEGLKAFAEKRAPHFTDAAAAGRHASQSLGARAGGAEVARARHGSSVAGGAAAAVAGPRLGDWAAGAPLRSNTRRRPVARAFSSKAVWADAGEAAASGQPRARAHGGAPPRRSTIFALSSGTPPSGVAVVRVSGPSADAALRALWPDLESGRAALPPPREMRLARLAWPAAAATAGGASERDGAGLTSPAPLSTAAGQHPAEVPPGRHPSRTPLDRALVVRFPAPGSFTGEDTVELHLHGGAATAAAARAALLALPAALRVRAARAGEFARRAYEAGKLDLTEVEGLADLLAAQSEAQRRLALAAAGGAARRAVAGWRERLLRSMARLEAVIDFGEDAELGAAEAAAAISDLAEIRSALESHAAAFSRAEVARAGARAAIAGRPNVGKSSLLNALAGRRAAIVSAAAGTTRDVVQVPLMVAGHRVAVADSAGLRATDCPIEAQGVSRALEEAREAGILIWVCDAWEAVSFGSGDSGGGGGGGGLGAEAPSEQRGQAAGEGGARPGPGGAGGGAAAGGGWVDAVLTEIAGALGSSAAGDGHTPYHGAPAALGADDAAGGAGAGAGKHTPPPGQQLLILLSKADLVDAALLAQVASAGRRRLSELCGARGQARAAAAGMDAAAAAAARWGAAPPVILEPVSCVTGAGVSALADAVGAAAAAAAAGAIGAAAAPPLLARLRHRELALEAAAHLKRAVELGGGGDGSSSNGDNGEGGATGSASAGAGNAVGSEPATRCQAPPAGALELAAEEVRLADAALSRLTGAAGARDVEGMLDRLFAEFCVGK